MDRTNNAIEIRHRNIAHLLGTHGSLHIFAHKLKRVHNYYDYRFNALLNGAAPQKPRIATIRQQQKLKRIVEQYTQRVEDYGITEYLRCVAHNLAYQET